jgi:hypothetical protein
VNDFLLRPEAAPLIRQINNLLSNPMGRKIVCGAITAARNYSQAEGSQFGGGATPTDRAQAAFLAAAFIYIASLRNVVCSDTPGPP